MKVNPLFYGGWSPDRFSRSASDLFLTRFLDANRDPLRLKTLPSGRTEAAAAALGRGERGHGNQFGLDYLCDHHLCDALAAPDRERRLAMIDQEHADLAAIVGVHRAGRVQHRYAVLGRQTRAGPNLC